MIAQAYFDKEPSIRVFYRGLIAEIPLDSNDCSDRTMDRKLRRLRIRRVGPWQQTDWGAEAKVEFVSK